MQCPSRGPALECITDPKVRTDGKCAFCGGVVGRITDPPIPSDLPERGNPVPGVCRPPRGMHLAIIYLVDGQPNRGLCRAHLHELYRRG